MKIKHIKTTNNFNKFLLLPLVKHIEDNLLHLENMLLEHLLNEFKIKSLIHLVAYFFIDKDKFKEYKTGINILVEKKFNNTIFNEMLLEYYQKEQDDIKINIFLSRLSVIVSDFFIKSLETKDEIKKYRVLLNKHELTIFSPYKNFLTKKDKKKTNQWYRNIEKLINQHENNTLTNNENLKLKTIILETIIDSSIQLQQKHQILNKEKNAPIENNRTELLMLFINNQNRLKAEPRKTGNSATKKTIGNTDFVLLQNNKILSFCEAININKNSFSSSKIKEHINRIFLYDTNGLPFNFLILYIDRSENIPDIWIKYSNKVNNLNLQYKASQNIINISPGLNFLRESSIIVGSTKHNRNNKDLEVFHILVFL